MSLIIWIPFRGSGKNQGLGEWEYRSGSSFRYADGGKMGTALSLDASTEMFSQTLSGVKVFSVAFWIYSKSSTTLTSDWNRCLWLGCIKSDGGSSSDFRFENTYSYLPRAVSMHNNDGYAITSMSPVIVKNKDEWHHVCVTNDSKNIYVYCDGKLLTKGTSGGGSLTGKIGIGSSGYPGFMNDLRIYDHCLSPKEVKEISKGLILHYPLNAMTENLWTSGNFTDTGWICPKNASNMTWTGPKIVIPSDAKVGDKFTISFNFEYEGFENMPSNFDAWFQGTTYNSKGGVETQEWNWSMGNPLSHAVSTKYPITTIVSSVSGSMYCWVTFTIPSSFTSADRQTGYGFGARFDYSNGTAKYRVTNMMICRGTTPLAFSPCKTDSNYDFTEYDVSGYGNNGYVTSDIAPEWDPDSIRYSGCYKFPSSKYLICSQGGKVSDEITVSIWAHMDTWSSWPQPVSCTENGGWNMKSDNSYPKFPVYVAGIGYKVAQSSSAISTLTSGWHMFTGTFDGINVKFYIDGILKGSATTGKTTKTRISYNSSNTIFLHVEAAGTATVPEATRYADCKLSDFRIYATALSETDIQELYSVSASVTNNGTLMLNGEVIEV